MKFVVKEVNERPMAYFQDEPSPRDWLLSFFLEDTRHDVQMYLNEISKAETGKTVPSGFTGNHVDIEFYPDRAVIEELYPADEENFQKMEIPLQKAKQLLLDWENSLNKWREKNLQ